MDPHQIFERSFAIGKGPIGPDAPTYVIAEAGVNHNGDLGRALRMVEAAIAAGADAVKFQVFSAERLTSASAPAAEYQKAPSQRELLSGLELNEEQFGRIAELCGQAGIEMLATPFGIEDVAMLGRLGVRAIKLASPDVTNIPLLSAAGATGSPIILSTGAATMDEIRRAMAALAEAGAREVALLHCVSSYPTPLEKANLRCIGVLADAFGVPAGYSDHTRETITGELAVRVGACVLEKHFTLDHRLVGPDHAMSMAPRELAEYVARAKAAPRGQLNESALSDVQRLALGGGVKSLQDIEQDVRRVARSSVTSGVGIQAGTVIRREMLTVKRPGGGIEPAKIDSLSGRKARVDIPADTTMTPDMLQ